jgi:hypothetical protein
MGRVPRAHSTDEDRVTGSGCTTPDSALGCVPHYRMLRDKNKKLLIMIDLKKEIVQQRTSFRRNENDRRLPRIITMEVDELWVSMLPITKL